MSAFRRNITVEMDWVDESSFEIRGSLDDLVHSLAARLLISFPDYTIREASGEITRMPYPGFCQGAAHILSKLVGLRVGRGFRKRAAEIVGGAESCNHLHTLITDMAACAFQMNYIAAKRSPEAQAAIREIGDDHAKRRAIVLGWMPQLRNTCYIFSEANDSLFELKREKEAGSDPAKTPNEEQTDGKIF